MKKTMLIFILFLGLFRAWAQEAPGVLTITGQRMYATGNGINFTASYTPLDATYPEITDYLWELRTVDEDGNPGEVLYSLPGQGDPSGSFSLPESVTADLDPATSYKLSLSAMLADGMAFSAPADVVFGLASYVLDAPDEIPCGDGVSATVDISGAVVASSSGGSHEWKLTSCDADGNILPSDIVYHNASYSGLPATGSYSMGDVPCNAYYKIELAIYDNNQLLIGNFSKVVAVSNYILYANSSYCTGSPVTVSGLYSPGTSTAVVANHAWALRDYNPVTQQASNNILWQTWMPGLPGSPYIIPYTNFVAGQYYQVELIFWDGNGQEVANSRQKKVFYIAPIFQPVISGTSPACGTGTYSVTNLPAGANYTYQWIQQEQNLTTTAIPGASSLSSSVTIPYPGYYANVGVYVTTNYGCKNSSPQFMAVNNSHKDLGFSVFLQAYSGPGTSANTYKIRVQRWYHARPDTFTVERVYPGSGSTYLPSFASINPSGLSNLAWGSGSVTASSQTPFYFYNYNGTGPVYNDGYPNHTIGVNDPLDQGIFLDDSTYRITQTKNVSGCPPATYSLVLNKAGLRCVNCRTLGPQSDEESFENASLNKLVNAANNNTLDVEVFPNPNNGTFRITLPATTGVAKAEMVDATGRVVETFTINAREYNYTPSRKFTAGMYILHINNGGANYNSIVVIK